MATNKYFNHLTYTSEQDLYEDLVIESIQIGGHDVYYLPREIVKMDEVFKEPDISKFLEGQPIEVFIEEPTGMQGSGDLLNKLGIEEDDSLSIMMSRKRFEAVATEHGWDRPRPREGDIIYIGVDDQPRSFINAYFEIRFVEAEEPFWNLGKQLVYQLKISKFVYSYETFEQSKNFLFDEEHRSNMSKSLYDELNIEMDDITMEEKDTESPVRSVKDVWENKEERTLTPEERTNRSEVEIGGINKTSKNKEADLRDFSENNPFDNF